MPPIVNTRVVNHRAMNYDDGLNALDATGRDDDLESVITIPQNIDYQEMNNINSSINNQITLNPSDDTISMHSNAKSVQIGRGGRQLANDPGNMFAS